MENNTKSTKISNKIPHTTRNKNKNNKSLDISNNGIKNLNKYTNTDTKTITEANENANAYTNTFPNILTEENNNNYNTGILNTDDNETIRKNSIININYNNNKDLKMKSKDKQTKSSNLKKNSNGNLNGNRVNNIKKKEVKRLRDLFNDDSDNNFQSPNAIDEIKYKIYSEMNFVAKDGTSGKKLEFKDFYNNTYNNSRNSKGSVGKSGGNNLKNMLDNFETNKTKNNNDNINNNNNKSKKKLIKK